MWWYKQVRHVQVSKVHQASSLLGSSDKNPGDSSYVLLPDSLSGKGIITLKTHKNDIVKQPVDPKRESAKGLVQVINKVILEINESTFEGPRSSLEASRSRTFGGYLLRSDRNSWHIDCLHYRWARSRLAKGQSNETRSKVTRTHLEPYPSQSTIQNSWCASGGCLHRHRCSAISTNLLKHATTYWTHHEQHSADPR